MTDEPLLGTNPLERIREGMTVSDASGRPLGTVTRVKMGDPEAVTTEGNEPPPSLLGSAWGGDADGLGDDVPAVLRRHLRRAGFVEVDGPTLHGVERLIPGDRIADVSGDIVRLHPVTGVASERHDSPAEPVMVEARETSSAPSETYRVYPVPPPEPGENNTQSGLSRSRLPLLLGAALALAGAAAVWAYLRRRREQARPIDRVRSIATRLRSRSAEALEDSQTATGAKVLPILLAVALWAWRAWPSPRSVNGDPRGQ
jgi:hypothetical protein